jgi:peptidoglycan/LPS O-acetylase OafA/YrhL
VAWSLAVEEWFYLLFPLWMWACTRIRFRPIPAALIFCAGIQAARLWAVVAGNVDSIRTLTWLRLDAIAMGFILWNLRSYRPGLILGGVLILIFGLGVGILATTSQLASLSGWQKWAFIQAAMTCSVLTLGAFIRWEPPQTPAWFCWICEWGGRVSYPLYLFHLFFLSKAEKTLPNFCLYLVGLTVFCVAFHMIVEMPILRRRPTYDPQK